MLNFLNDMTSLFPLLCYLMEWRRLTRVSKMTPPLPRPRRRRPSPPTPVVCAGKTVRKACLSLATQVGPGDCRISAKSVCPFW